MNIEKEHIKFKRLFEDSLQELSVPEISSKTDETILFMIENQTEVPNKKKSKQYKYGSLVALFLIGISTIILPGLNNNDETELQLAMKHSRDLEDMVKATAFHSKVEPSIYLEVAKVKNEILYIDEELSKLYSQDKAEPDTVQELELWNLRTSKLHSILKVYNSQRDLYSI